MRTFLRIGIRFVYMVMFELVTQFVFIYTITMLTMGAVLLFSDNQMIREWGHALEMESVNSISMLLICIAFLVYSVHKSIRTKDHKFGIYKNDKVFGRLLWMIKRAIMAIIVFLASAYIFWFVIQSGIHQVPVSETGLLLWISIAALVWDIFGYQKKP